jgi:hypothetical protein
MKDSDTEVPKSSAVQKILNHPAMRREPEPEEPRDSYQKARVNSNEAIMLDVKLEDGSIVSLPYNGLRRVRYLPGDTMMLRFESDEVHVDGRNLARLRDSVTEHRTRSIQEGTASEQGLKPEDETHITRITIVEQD